MKFMNPNYFNFRGWNSSAQAAMHAGDHEYTEVRSASGTKVYHHGREIPIERRPKLVPPDRKPVEFRPKGKGRGSGGIKGGERKTREYYDAMFGELSPGMVVDVASCGEYEAVRRIATQAGHKALRRTEMVDGKKQWRMYILKGDVI